MLRTQVVVALLVIARAAGADEPLDHFLSWMNGPWVHQCMVRFERARHALGRRARAAEVEHVFFDDGPEEQVSLSLDVGGLYLWATARVDSDSPPHTPERWHRGRNRTREAVFKHGRGEVDVKGPGNVAKMVAQLERAIDDCLALVDTHVKTHGKIVD